MADLTTSLQDSTKFLNDRIFLDKIDSLPLKEQYVRVTVLSWEEETIREIQGEVISGSVNIDGNSSLRRTCNLTFFTDQYNNNFTDIDLDLSINKKIKLEIGIKNTVSPYIYSTVENNNIVKHTINYQNVYGDIIWFPLGIYVIFDPSVSYSTSGCTISLSLKDKMCLLNGDAGGVIPASVQLHEKEQVDLSGQTIYSQPTIRQSIIECVNHYGGEQLSRIVVSDLEERTKKVMRYNGSKTLYLANCEKKFYTEDKDAAVAYATSQGGSADDIIEFTAGQDVGYVLTDFTYPGELVADIGDTVTSVLDKITSVLGNFEYFYDIYGVFHFQEIKNYLNTTYTTTALKEYSSRAAAAKEKGYVIDEVTEWEDEEGVVITDDGGVQMYAIDLGSETSVYTFENNQLINAIINTPKYSNIKNDFVVWGEKDLGDDLPTLIRYHLVIDKKPEIQVDSETGKQFYGKHEVVFYKDDKGNTRATICNDNTNTVSEEEYAALLEDVSTKTAKAEYEISLVENESEAVKQAVKDKYYGSDGIVTQARELLENSAIGPVTVYTLDWREELYYQGIEAIDTATDYNYYYTELCSEWPKLYDLESQVFKVDPAKDPGLINYYLDMIDSSAEVGKYQVSNIGRRTMAVMEDSLNCVFEQDIPDIIIIDEEYARADNYLDIEKTLTTAQVLEIKQSVAKIEDEEVKETNEIALVQEAVKENLTTECILTGQAYAIIDKDAYDTLVIGGYQNSCYQKVCSLLYQYINMNTTISLTTLPIYHLEPNTRITIKDNEFGICGDYIVTSMSIPLDVNSMMNISAYLAQTKM